MEVWQRLSNLSDWMHTDDHANMVYLALAFTLLAELSFRVVRRFLSDRRAKIDAAHGNLRVSTRLRRAPSA
jgi:hypothetical protein